MTNQTLSNVTTGTITALRTGSIVPIIVGPLPINGISIDQGFITADQLDVGTIIANDVINVDTINENTLAHGVDIAGINIKNGLITATGINLMSTDQPVKPPCRLATTVPIVGSLSGTLNIDGFDTNDLDRILIKDQIDPVQNGIYIASSTTTWTRASDGNMHSTLVTVTDGNDNFDSLWYQSFDHPTPGVTYMTFVKFAPSSGGGTDNHDELISLQGPRYYHLTTAQYNKAGPFIDSANVIMSNLGDLTVRNFACTSFSLSGSFAADNYIGNTIPSNISLVTNIGVSWSANNAVFNIPTGSEYEFRINNVVKAKIVQSSIATDHLFGLDTKHGVTMMAGLHVNQLDGTPLLDSTDTGLVVHGETFKDGSNVGSWFINSDRRIKTNVTSMSMKDSYRYINSIDVRSFKYLSDSSDNPLNIGIIANEIESVHEQYLPSVKSPVITKDHCVNCVEYKEFKHFESGSLVYHLINVCKVLSRRVDYLKETLIGMRLIKKKKKYSN